MIQSSKRVLEVASGIQPHRPLLFLSGGYRKLDYSQSLPAPDLTNVHDYTFAAADAKLDTSLTVALRDKAIGAFNEIMRMQV